MQIYCCYEKKKLVGVIAFRNLTHISLLFVRKSHHKRGIAKELLKIGINNLLLNHSNVKELTVNSSPYAVEIYKKLGFASTDMQEKDGILFMPMKKELGL